MSYRRIRNISEQMVSLKTKLPHCNIISYSHVFLNAQGKLKPTARSISYTIQIKYRLGENPQVLVIDPPLERNFNGDRIEHMYRDGSLCLHRPRYKHFTASMLIADTIVPWTTLWLYHYENWHISGTWEGGGEHPNT